MRTVLRVLAVAVILSLPIVYSSCADGGGGRTGPDPLPAETLASFDLSVPDSITEGEGFSLTVTAVGSRGTKPLTSYSGTAFLSTTLGTVSPSSLAVSNGAGSGQVTLSTPGPQTLTASGGGRTGSVGVEVTDLPDPTIPGDPNATMEQAVQDSVYLPDPEDYSIGHPEFSGVHLSHNTILVAFKAGTTVGEANDLLVPFGADLVGAIQGVSGAVATILILKLPTENHLELDTVLAELRNSDLVVEASADALMQPLAVPGDKSGRPFDWTWEVEPEGGNWGLELSRVPQMWNLNGALSKAEALVWTGVYDVGFIDGHEDLPPDLPFINLSPSVLNDHGNLSAGIIGAKFNNPVGIDGVNPFSGLIVQASTWSSATGPSESASLAQSLTNLATLMDQYPEIRVLNISMGYTQEVDTNTDLAWQQKVDADGLLFAEVLRGVGMNQPVPLITAAAGNESNLGFGLQSARYASPYCNAAFEHAVHSVLCIENVEYDKDGVGQAKRWTTSNVGGHFSAPGTEVRTTGVSPDGYPLATGTSSAAPLAAGVVGYMLAVEPTLTIPQIREALFRTSIPVGGFANNRIDAWAAVMEIDRVKGGDKVLKMMLDIDDGTPDGNQRVDYSDQPEFPDYEEEDADEDGGIGDGKVDMSDFRRWRDWVLILEDPDDLALDGEMDHPKHDVNGNGQVDLPAQEEIYPRGDFNGDGKLSTDEEDKAFVPGAINDEVTDLDVFKLVFDDPHYDKDELDTLVFSSDITVDASIAFDVFATPPITTGVWKAGTPYRIVTLTREEPQAVFTVKSDPAGWRVWVREGGPSSARFADSSYKPLARWVGTDATMWPIRPFQVDVKSTFLNSCDDAGATTAQPISLASLQLVPGDYLFLDGAGTWPPVEELVAVFSASSELKVETEEIPSGDGNPPKILTKRTVTDAIALGSHLLGGSPYSSPATKECDGIPTDIPQDFTPFQVSFVKIPDGATHLFLGMGSDYYSDKSQYPDPIRVEISKWYAPEWHDMHQPVPPGGGR